MENYPSGGLHGEGCGHKRHVVADEESMPGGAQHEGQQCVEEGGSCVADVAQPVSGQDVPVVHVHLGAGGQLRM